MSGLEKDRVLTRFPRCYGVQRTPYGTHDYDPIVKSACQRDKTNIDVQHCKAVIVGDVAVGKTAMVNRFCHDVFQRDYKGTIGVDFEVEKFSVLSIPFTVQLWDTAGQERFKCIAAAYYRGTNVLIVAFDLSDINTLGSARTWYSEAAATATDPIVFLVGMKMDMLSPAAYASTEIEAMKLAEEIGAEYWPTSSKTGENVQEFFFRLVGVTFNHMVSSEISGRGQQSKSIGSKLGAIKKGDLFETKKPKKFQCALL